MAGPELYTFGGFTLDVGERRLTKHGQAVPLSPKAHDVLVALVRDAGRLIRKEELLVRVWSGAFVEEGILNVHVAALREALGDDSRSPWCIETVTRSGYRFKAAVSTLPPVEPAAHAAESYELVGRGRFHLLSASRPEVEKALDAYRAVAEREPAYAAAHAGLALAHCASAELRLATPAEAYREARGAALRALAMDAGSADAQVALGIVLFLGEWNWFAAERCFKRALALNPDHTEAYVLYGRLLETLGRLQEGLDMKLKALERDPFSPAVHLQIALSYWNQRRYDDVIEWSNKTLALDPNHLLAREYLAGAYLAKGDFDRHMDENIKHAERFGAPPSMLEPLKEAYRAGGRRGVLEYSVTTATNCPYPPPAAQLALLYAEIGDLDAAFPHLERAIDSLDPCLVHLAVAPQWDHLRLDPRFSKCLARMGLNGIPALQR